MECYEIHAVHLDEKGFEIETRSLQILPELASDLIAGLRYASMAIPNEDYSARYQELAELMDDLFGEG